MLLDAPAPAARCYSVEVSGWNSTQHFFVETCELVWREDSGRQVALRQSLPANAILFVRLLRPGESAPSRAVVYKAELLGDVANGHRLVRLNPVEPQSRE